MRRQYSRLQRVEEQKSVRQTFIFGGLTIGLIIFLLFFGIPLIARFAAFLSDLRGSNRAVEVANVPPPGPPIFSSLPQYSTEERITVEGTTQSGATVIISFNSIKKEVVAGADGKFTSAFTLVKGTNIISAVAKNKNSPESAESRKHTVILDKDAPKIEIKSPSDGATYYGSQRTITVEGKVDTDSSISINDRMAIVGSDGTFRINYSLSDGENALNIIAIDKAGNKTEQSLKVTYTP